MHELSLNIDIICIFSVSYVKCYVMKCDDVDDLQDEFHVSVSRFFELLWWVV